MKPLKPAMNKEPKNKILLIIISVLLLSNIVLVIFLLKPFSKNGPRGNRTEMIATFLQKEIGFNQQQLKQYDSLSEPNRTKVKAMFEALRNDKENKFKQLASEKFSDSVIINISTAIATQQEEIEIILYKHYRDIRNLCSTTQQPVFDSLFYKVLNRKFTPQKN